MTEEPPHPISLDSVFFTRCSVVAVPGHVPTPGLRTPGPSNHIHVMKVEGEIGVFQASMKCLLNAEMDKSYPYSVDMECVAEIRVDDTLSEDEAQRGVHITANSVLYGAIRESVAWLTSRQVYGPLMLGLSVIKPKPLPDKRAKTPPKAKKA